MNKISADISLYFSGGALGGLTNSLALWLTGLLGINAALGVRLAPAITPEWLYPRLVWGGIWGAMFFLPLMGKSITLRGILLSLGPTAVQLFIVFPIQAEKGTMGLELGALTPALVVFFNALWGITAAHWIRFASGTLKTRQ